MSSNKLYCVCKERTTNSVTLTDSDIKSEKMHLLKQPFNFSLLLQVDELF